MSLLYELGLTPSQVSEVEEADQELVTAWLSATANARGLKSPAGFFLHGVRSGMLPAATSDGTVRLARARMLNLRHGLPSEAEAYEEIFGSGGLLRHRAEDRILVEEFLDLWREGQRG